MLKVLIADDESKVAQLIRYLVDWSAFGMEIVATATDGQSAYELICKFHPEVVITDIRMPNLNGIELIQKVKSSGLDPFFIMISGFSEFEYAQKAIQLGVEDYLLKPLKKKDLESVLLKISEKYEISVKNREKTSSLLDQLDQSKQKIRNNLLTDLLVKKNPGILTMSESALSEEYQLNLQEFLGECMVVQLFTGNSTPPSAYAEIYGFVLPKLSEKIESLLSSLCRNYLSVIINNEIIILISHRVGEYSGIIDHLQKLRIDLLNYSNIYSDLRIAIGISRPITSIFLLQEAYSDASAALEKRFTDDTSFYFESQSYFRSSAQSLLPNSIRKKMTEQIEYLDIAGFESTYQDAVTDLRSHLNKGCSIHEFFSTVIDVFLYAIGTFDELDSASTISRDALLTTANTTYAFNDVCNSYLSLMKSVLEKLAEEKQNLEMKPIRSAKQYINDHFSEPLTLETVSAEIGFHPAYFSSLFKKATGQNFMDYLKDVRISNAKSMLQYTTKDVNTVANSVGYSDIKYFSKLFRAKTNLTPSEFRKLYG